MMEKMILILTAALGLTMSAHAGLGDNYATVCKLYGSKGKVAYQSWVYFPSTHNDGTGVFYQFRNNQAVAINWQTPTGNSITEREVLRVLESNSGGQEWHVYSVKADGQHCYTNSDQTMVALLINNGSFLRMSYSSWADREGKWASSNDQNVQPPVQEDDAVKATGL
jgi:hypothetical protein